MIAIDISYLYASAPAQPRTQTLGLTAQQLFVLAPVKLPCHPVQRLRHPRRSTIASLPIFWKSTVRRENITSKSGGRFEFSRMFSPTSIFEPVTSFQMMAADPGHTPEPHASWRFLHLERCASPPPARASEDAQHTNSSNGNLPHLHLGRSFKTVAYFEPGLRKGILEPL